MKTTVLVMAFCFAMFGVVVVPNAKADSGNQEMVVTVKKGPVELPGHVLMPGKYDMQFTDLEHNVVLVRTADGKQPIGFFMVIPTTRNRITDNPKLDVGEAARGSVAKLNGFFYPDRKTGYEFIFPQPTANRENTVAQSKTATHS